MNKKIELHIDFINKSIEERKPIDWISRHVGVSRNTIKSHFPDYKGSQGYNVERVKELGVIETITKTCERCNTKFTITGRTKTKTFYRRRFCSVSCAKARDEYWKNNMTNYATICWKNHKKECIICGEDKIVAVHHYDKNHSNNKPENLVPLCPTHHQYIHSKYETEISDKVDKYVEQFKGGLV